MAEVMLVIKRLLNRSSIKQSAVTNITPLSPRQAQILNQIAKGYSNRQIAHSFGISEQTVKNQVVSILDKLGANNRTHAVVLALLNGSLKIEDISTVRSSRN